MLNKLSSAAKPAPMLASWAFCAGVRSFSAPATPISLPPKISWIIGDAMPMTPIPALTFMHRTIQSSQNCGVRHARLTCTLCAVIIELV